MATEQVLLEMPETAATPDQPAGERAPRLKESVRNQLISGSPFGFVELGDVAGERK